MSKMGESVESSSAENKKLSQTQPHDMLVGLSKLAKVLFLFLLLAILASFHYRISHLENIVVSKPSLDSSHNYESFKSESSEHLKNLNSNSQINGVKSDDIVEKSTNNKRVKRRIGHERHSGSHSNDGHGSNNRHVDFMFPRSYREAADESSNDSVLLTSFSRIPLMAIQDFCSKTKDYCPPGPPGPRGLPGQKGDLGEKGDNGDRGPRGPLGHTGPHGLRGIKGEPGNPGVEGRDGLPGEPGLDGIPGRNGLDGIPGMEGLPGRNGLNGRDGKNGTDGKIGPMGPKGEAGIRGLPGPTGPTGLSGRDGVPGYPGINATIYSGGPPGKKEIVLIPPSIIGSATKMRPLVVMEGENVKLSCSATGSPHPEIKWKKEDGTPIRIGSWTLSSVDGHLLNFTKVNRIHMGKYLCYADNSVSPSATKLHEIHVNFAPLIQVKTQQSGVILGRTGYLECEVEAFPRGATSWQTAEGKFITSNDTKYQTSTIEYDIYKSKMMLNVSRVAKSDLSSYFCIAKNAFGIVKGQVSLIEWAPNQPTLPPYAVSPTGPGVIYGKKRPDIEDTEDLCPVAPPCPTCPPRLEPSKCIFGGYQLIDKFAWDVYPLGDFKLPEDKNRTALGGCQLSAVGKPVFHGEFKESGSWMRETSLELESEKYFKTRSDATGTLYEYYNKTTFSKDLSYFIHSQLTPHFQGNFHVIFNGSFYYVAERFDFKKDEKLKVVRYSLSGRKSIGEIDLPYSSYEAGTLYSSESGRTTESRVDLTVDENGLWAIYTLPAKNNTAIVKIEVFESRMEIVFGWNITISHKHAGDMFIICGVLYAVDSVTERDTKIRLALDLYRRQLIKIDLSFSNPFKKTVLVSYNPKTKELFTLDDGNLLIYPVKHMALGPLVTQDENK